MKKFYFKYIFSIILIGLLMLVPNKVLAVTEASDYTIQRYNIDMIVNEDNTYDITETITAYFNIPKHGIYRKIPLKNSITRTDGTKSSNRARITNVNVSENYTISKENGYEVIKIGSASSTITGSHTYTIKYKYNIGKDPLKDADELYFNLIGDEWDTSISNINFKITMPKEFDSSSLGFSSGSKGSTNSSNVSYSVIENTISGHYANTLRAGEALTVRLTLPEGYFVGASSNFDAFSIGAIAFSIACVLIAYLFWSKYGKDDEVIETVEFYPPEGYNSAEVGFLYKGKSDDKSIISLLIYLANKGYLKIEDTSSISINNKEKIKLSDSQREQTNLKIQELENKIKEEKLRDANSQKIKIWENSLEVYKNIDKPVEYEMSAKEKSLINRALKSSKKETIIRKIKEYDGNNDIERIFFNELFSPNKSQVKISELYNKFYMTINRIKAKLNSKENKKKIFDSSASKKIKWLIVMIISIFLLITIKPVVEYLGFEGLPFALIFPGIGFSVLFGMLLGNTPIATKIFGLIWGLGFGGMPWAFMVLPALTYYQIYLLTYIIGIICIALLIFFVKIMPKRTPYGNGILGKLRGFKRFLETAEKPELEGLVKKNPEYFYNILPYTYALGVSEVWMKQFETIAMQAPDWYDSNSGFHITTFNNFMDDTMKSAQQAMTSAPSESSGGSSGGFSGGGSSGGGSGGGGGGSW